MSESLPPIEDKLKCLKAEEQRITNYVSCNLGSHHITRLMRMEQEVRDVMQARERILLRQREEGESNMERLDEADDTIAELEAELEEEIQSKKKRIKSLRSAHKEELRQELERKDRESEALLKTLRGEKAQLEQISREKLRKRDREIKERVQIQEDMEKCMDKEREKKDIELEVEKESARKLLNEAKKSHSKREKELLEALNEEREQAKGYETKLQEQLRKEEGRGQDIERVLLAIEKEKAQVHQELYNRLLENFSKEKALLMEGFRKDIEQAIREHVEKKWEPTNREEEEAKVDEQELEGERPMIGEEFDSTVARD